MEQGLLELYLQRSETAISRTEAMYGPYCRAIVSSILTQKEDVEECLDDVWLSAWNAIPPTRPLNFKAWIGAVARNAALARLRRLRKSPPTAPLEELCASLSDGRDPAGVLQAAALAEAISDFLRRQGQKKRVAFVRRYWYRDSVAEMASRLDWSVGKTKSILFRMRNRLEEELRKEGLLQ